MSAYSPQEQPQMFGQGSPQQPDDSAARQLISEIAPINSALMGLAQAHPEMAESIDQMLQLLKQAITQSLGQMQGGQEGGQPAYG